MSDINEQKALQLLSEAERKKKSSYGFFSSFFGGSSKIDEATELYQRAANMFKLAKNWNSAGQSFYEAATLHIKNGSKHDASANYIDAASCFRKTDPSEAINCYLKAIEIYTDLGRFVMAARHHQSIAEIYETELSDTEKAIHYYEQAADYYRGEENTSSANRCILKVAHYKAMLEKYDDAAKIYEQVAISSISNTLLKYTAKDHFFRAALCHLCIDVLNASLAVKRYEEMLPSLEDSREFKFLKTILIHVEEQNLDAFTETVRDFDSICRLDQWYATMLLRIKRSLNDTDPDLR